MAGSQGVRTVLITGASGSLGTALNLPTGWRVARTDLDSLDVREQFQVDAVIGTLQPDLIYHLAGAKHAPEGETDPVGVYRTNVDGTVNVLEAADRVGAKVIVASTCKAANPETAYGASKLIAERVALNAGHVVVRFYNVKETSGNVFAIWDQLPATAPIPVTPGRRYWLTLAQATGLLRVAADLPTGRYTLDPGPPRWMVEIAAELYPGRWLRAIPLRRGDRPLEPLCADNETLIPLGDGLIQITSAHDPPCA